MSRLWEVWTSDDLSLLRDAYPTGGLPAARKALPHRTDTQLQNAITRYGLTRSGRKKYDKYPPNALMDAAIIQAYKQFLGGQRGAIKALARRTERSYAWIRWRALELGVRKPHMPCMTWSAEEDAILREHIDLGLKAVQRYLRRRGYTRAQSAIQLRKQMLKLQATHPDYITATGAAHLLGVDIKTITRWINRYGLRSHKMRFQTPDTAPGEPHYWAIHVRDLREFLKDHPAMWDVRRVQQHFWLIELLAGPPALATRQQSA